MAERTWLVGIDGRSGAGKTTLAAALAAALAGELDRGRDRERLDRVPIDVFHLEDVYPGWDGLSAGMDRYRAEVLEPLAAGRTARWTDWDWAGDRPGRTHLIAPGGVVIAEGVGAGHAAARPLLDVLVWVQVPADQRRQRALARDGDLYRPHWSRWAAQEQVWLDVDDVAAAADVVVEDSNDVDRELDTDAIARHVLRRLTAQPGRG